MNLISDYISHEELRRQLNYDPETGWLTWKIRKPRISQGSRAGSPHSKGTRTVCIEGRNYLEHRLIWFWMTGEDPGIYVDHKNRIKDDNRWGNLRLATHGQNYVNSLQFGEMRGICPHGSGFRVRIGFEGRRIHVNGIKTLDEAKRIRRDLELELYGEFACIR